MGVIFNLDDGSKKMVRCYAKLNILGHAQLETIFLGSQCGGHGICGKDKVQVMSNPSDLSIVTENERRLLSTQEIKDGVRLGCQAFPQHDDAEIIIKVLCPVSPIS